MAVKAYAESVGRARSIVNYDVTSPPSAFDRYLPAHRFRGFLVASRSWNAAMLTRAMLSRLLLTLGLLTICALMASALRAPKLRKQPSANFALALAIGDR